MTTVRIILIFENTFSTSASRNPTVCAMRLFTRQVLPCKLQRNWLSLSSMIKWTVSTVSIGLPTGHRSAAWCATVMFPFLVVAAWRASYSWKFAGCMLFCLCLFVFGYFPDFSTQIQLFFWQTQVLVWLCIFWFFGVYVTNILGKTKMFYTQTNLVGSHKSVGCFLRFAHRASTPLVWLLVFALYTVMDWRGC